MAVQLFRILASKKLIIFVFKSCYHSTTDLTTVEVVKVYHNAFFLPPYVIAYKDQLHNIIVPLVFSYHNSILSWIQSVFCTSHTPVRARLKKWEISR